MKRTHTILIMVQEQAILILQEHSITEANRGLCYTQLPVSIFIKDGIENIAYLPWYGVQPEDDDIVTATFGNSGFYGGWEIKE